MRQQKPKAETMKKVVAYTRVSTMGQAEDGESLDRQAARIRAYCEAKGLPEPEVICDEGLSGFKTNRDGFQRLVSLCESREVQTVIVYDLSRLSRSVRDTLEFIEDTINKNGIEFISLLNDIDTSTPTGKAFLGITAIFNQLYRDEIAYKTKEALSHKRAKKEKTGGVVPFGYELVDGVRLVPRADELETVKLIHSLRDQGLTLRGIVEVLSTKGIPTKTGKARWSPKVVRGILNRAIDQVYNDTTMTEPEKYTALHDLSNALFRVEDAA